MGKSCVICNKPSGMYPLCTDCLKDKADGKVIKCDICKTWHRINEGCKCPNNKNSSNNSSNIINNNKCIVCNNNAPNGSLCKECYTQMIDYKDTFDKNSKSFELKDYYYNLKSNIYRMKYFSYVSNNCNKLMALAVLLKDLYNDNSLYDKVNNDIIEIIKTKKPKEEIKEIKEIEYIKAQDSRKEEYKRTTDGHYVKSFPESIIDDILYINKIVHCYEKDVIIDADEPSIKCDWFIPVLNVRQGIYIEYWGMNTDEYNKNKERKRKQYKDHNIPLVEIDKDDYKDQQSLTNRLISEINKLAKNHFNIIDFIK